MRYLLLLLLVGCLPAWAQSPPAIAGPDSLVATAAPASPDTAAAIHRLFAARRRGRRLAVKNTLLGGAALPVLLLTFEPFAAAIVVLGEAEILVAVGLELFFFRHYSRANEQRALAAWQAHRLPPRIQRKLVSHYFQPAPAP